MDDIPPPRSYGPLIETTLPIITRNVTYGGLYGPWLKRDAAIVATVQADAARVLDEINIV
jgi:hypothetical protein